MGGDRPRIQKTIFTETIVDTEAYTQNSASKNARLIKTLSEKINTEFWIDKHYSNREQFGDENGAREGIEIEFVEELVTKSFKHLKYYSLKHKKFSFVNHPPPKFNNLRVTLKQVFKDELTLNIIAEYHFISLNNYEVTVVTAMRKDDFYFSEGQYCIEFTENESVLFFKQENKVNKLDEYSE
ncbi:MAG: hypothetical protein ABI793_02745 [Flavobacterium sp.]